MYYQKRECECTIIKAQVGLKHLYLDELMRNELKSFLKDFLSPNIVDEKSDNFLSNCSFSNLENFIFVIDGENMYQIKNDTLQVSKVTVEELLPETPSNSLYREVKTKVVEKILDFSDNTQLIEHPVLEINKKKITDRREESNSVNELAKILSHNYVNVSVANRLAQEIFEEFIQEHDLLLVNTDGIHVFKKGNLTKLTLSINEIVDKIRRDFQYIPELLDSASKRIYYFFAYNLYFENEKLYALNCNYINNKGLYIEYSIGNKKIIWQKSSESKGSTFFPISEEGEDLYKNNNLLVYIAEHINVPLEPKESTPTFEITLDNFGGLTATLYIQWWCSYWDSVCIKIK